MAWAALGFASVTGCASFVPSPDDLDKVATIDKIAMLVCAENEGKAHGVPAEQAFAEFCSSAAQIRPWVDRLSNGCGGSPAQNTGGSGGSPAQ